MIVLGNFSKEIKEIWIFFGGELIKVWPETTEKEDPEIIEEDIISCFARGYWISQYPWTELLGWKNNQ